MQIAGRVSPVFAQTQGGAGDTITVETVNPPPVLRGGINQQAITKTKGGNTMRILKTIAFIIILCLIATIACGKKEKASDSSDTQKEVAVQESKEESKEEEAENKEADADKDSEEEAEPAEDEEQEADSAEDEEQEASGIRPEFKEAMDSYEEFFDEYIDFMDTYSKSDNPISLMAEYADYMQKYADAMEKLDAMEDDLSDEELVYYTEVMGRINTKLAKASVAN